MAVVKSKADRGGDTRPESADLVRRDDGRKEGATGKHPSPTSNPIDGAAPPNSNDPGNKRLARAGAFRNGGKCMIKLSGKANEGWFSVEIPYPVLEHLNNVGEVGVVCDQEGTVILDPLYTTAGHYAKATERAREALKGAGGRGAAVGADDKDGADGGKGNPAL